MKIALSKNMLLGIAVVVTVSTLILGLTNRFGSDFLGVKIPPVNSKQPGVVSGNLCYPSHQLPPGIIEAKRLSDGKIFTQQFPGAEPGIKKTYTFQLEEGKYHLRYFLEENYSGYSTTVCPTGNETSCGDTKQRVLNTADVKPDKAMLNYHLCDFYYQPSNAPEF